MLSLKSLRGDKDEAPNVEATKSVVQNEDTSDVICGIKDETIKDGIALISLSGDIDATTAPIITTRIKEILGSENLTKLTFNLADYRRLIQRWIHVTQIIWRDLVDVIVEPVGKQQITVATPGCPRFVLRVIFREIVIGYFRR